MRETLIFATGNEGKMRELRNMLSGIDADIISMKEAGVYVDVEEDGSTFEENAILKARAVAEKSGRITLADDSGLEVDYLNKEPGIYSARYLGTDTPYTIKNNDILRRLEGVRDDERTARFVCAIAAVYPSGESIVVRAEMEGRIGYEEKGEHGFGYDPIFFLPDRNCYSAELLPDEKDRISHRGKAMELMKKELIRAGVVNPCKY